MRWVTGAGLLTSAFAPLVAVVALVRIQQLGVVAWVILLGCLLSVLFLRLVLRALSRLQERQIVSVEVRRADERVVSFTSSYVVPVVLAAFAPTDVPGLVATLGLLALMVVIYLRAGLYHLNPTLAVLGYRLFEVRAENGSLVMLLTRSDHLPQRGEVNGRYLSANVAVQVARPAARRAGGFGNGPRGDS